jgi:hypothetical protein
MTIRFLRIASSALPLDAEMWPGTSLQGFISMNGLFAIDPMGTEELKSMVSLSHAHGLSGLVKKVVRFDVSVFFECELKAVYRALVSANKSRRHERLVL